jgi:hypothetical protein
MRMLLLKDFCTNDTKDSFNRHKSALKRRKRICAIRAFAPFLKLGAGDDFVLQGAVGSVK